MYDEWGKRGWGIDSNRVRQKKKIQRSNIENNIDGICKRLQRKILWKIYPPKNYKHISEKHHKWPAQGISYTKDVKTVYELARLNINLNIYNESQGIKNLT